MTEMITERKSLLYRRLLGASLGLALGTLLGTQSILLTDLVFWPFAICIPATLSIIGFGLGMKITISARRCARISGVLFLSVPLCILGPYAIQRMRIERVVTALPDHPAVIQRTESINVVHKLGSPSFNRYYSISGDPDEVFEFFRAKLLSQNWVERWHGSHDEFERSIFDRGAFQLIITVEGEMLTVRSDISMLQLP